MDLHTKIKLPASKRKVNLGDHLFTIGSCFSQVMGVYLRQNKFEVAINPFGTVYNPISIAKTLDQVVFEKEPDEDGFVKNGEISYHYDFHSDLSELSKKLLKESIQKKILTNHSLIKKADWLMITFGSAIVYRLKEQGRVVANCHKVPQKEFDRGMLSLEEILTSYSSLIAALRKLNPNLKIILTVSPVRHVKEGLENNALSKALLRLACDQICHQHEEVFYFPSYEIMLDDLRDYRYYGHDLIHPNELAEQYIWDKFIETYLQEEDIKTLDKWQKLKRALDHRPRHPDTIEYKLFLKNTLTKIEQLNGSLDLRGEIAQIKSVLQNR